MLRLTMTDKLHYPDLFTTINIEETQNQLTLETKYLFDVVHGFEDVVYGEKDSDPDIFTFKPKITDTPEVAQIIWHLENEQARTIDHLAITIMCGRLAIGIEHRDLNKELGERTTEFRKSQVWGGVVYDYFNPAKIDDGSTSEFANSSFKKNFYDTTVANLGLKGQIDRLRDQNERSNAILANAA